jgi:site-specific DNA recombinase
MPEIQKLCGYVRVSTLKQVQFGVSIDSQKKKIMDYCQNNGFELTQMYSDEGISGKSLKRPGYAQLIKDCKAGLYQGVIFYDLDRASRSFIQLINDINILYRLGVKIISITKGEINLEDPESELMFHQMSAFAQYESRKISRRVKDNIYYCNSIGRHLHIAPFGYKKVKKKLEMDPKTSQTVNEMFNAYVTTDVNLIGLARQYRKTVRGMKIILSNPVYMGMVRNKKKVFKGTHIPLITEELFMRTRSKLDRLSRK